MSGWLLEAYKQFAEEAVDRDEPARPVEGTIMPTHRECEECAEVKRCRMYLDDTGARESAPIYLCASCARDHGFLPDPTRYVEREP